MTKDPFRGARRTVAAIALMAMAMACGGDDASHSGHDEGDAGSASDAGRAGASEVAELGPGIAADLRAGETESVEGSVELPDGVVAATVVNLLDDVDVTDGRFEITAYSDGPSLAVAFSEAGDPVAIGWIGPDSAVLSPRTTAEVIGYFALGGFLSPAGTWSLWPEQLARYAPLDDLADALSGVLEDRPAGFDETVDQRAATALEELHADLLGEPAEVNKALLVNPSGGRSGIDLDTTLGINELWVVNNYLRRAHLFIDRVAIVTEAGEMPRARSIADEPILGVAPIDSLGGTAANLLGGWAGGRDNVENPNLLWVPRRYGAFNLPNESGALRTRYRVAVVGPGILPPEGADEFSEYERELAAAALEATLTDVLTAFVWPMFTSLAIPAESWTNVGVSLFTEAAKQSAPLQTALSQGDAIGALEALVGFLGSGGGRLLLLDGLSEGLFDESNPERAAGTARARRMGAAFNRVMAVVDAVDLVARTIDLYALTRDLQDSRQGVVWTVDATDNTVNLEPREARVAQGSSIELTVHVPDAEDGALLEYRYATSSNLGTLTTTRGNGSTIEGDALTTTTPNVTFTADGGGSGVAAVIVEVFDARMSDRPLIGQAQSLVEVTEEIRGRGSLTVVMDAQTEEACAEVGRYAGLLWFYTCPDLGTPDLRMEARCTDDGAACPVGSEGVVMGSGPPFIDETAEWAHFVERYGPLADGSHWLLWGGQGNSGCSDEPPAELTAEVDCFGYDDGVDFTPVSCAELEPCCPNAGTFELECSELVATLDHSLHSNQCADMLELLQNSGLCR